MAPGRTVARSGFHLVASLHAGLLPRTSVDHGSTKQFALLEREALKFDPPQKGTICLSIPDTTHSHPNDRWSPSS